MIEPQHAGAFSLPGQRACAAAQQAVERIDRHGWAEQEALEDRAAVLLEEGLLLLRFHALRDHFQAEAVRQSHDRLDDVQVGRVRRDLVHERLVDLELVQGQFRQARQRRIPGAEIVDRKAHAERAQGRHLGARVAKVQQHAFRDFQLEHGRIDLVALDDLGHPLHEVGLQELARAGVDGQGQVRGAGIVLPCLELEAGRLQDPVADRQDQVGFLGQRNEVGRRHEAAFGMMPAQQHFGAHDRAGPHDLGLEEDLQLVAFHGEVDVALHGDVEQQGRLHARIEEPQGVAPALLGLVHGQVGVLQQVGHALRAGEHLDADAGGAAKFLVDQLVGQGQRHQDLFGDDARFRRRDSLTGRQSFQQDHELVAAQARHGVALAHGMGQPPRGLDQELVAHIVAAGIVDALEVVQVDEQQGAVRTRPGIDAEHVMQLFLQEPAVGQVGQGIVQGEPDQLGTAGHVAGDVEKHDHQMDRRFPVVGDGGHLHPQGRGSPILVAADDLAAPVPALAQHRGGPFRQRILARDGKKGQIPTLDLVRRVAGQFPEALVDLQDAATRIGDADAGGRFESDRGDAVALPDALLHAHVEQHQAQSRRRGRQSAHVGGHGAQGAAAIHELQFEVVDPLRTGPRRLRERPPARFGQKIGEALLADELFPGAAQPVEFDLGDAQKSAVGRHAVAGKWHLGKQTVHVGLQRRQPRLDGLLSAGRINRSHLSNLLARRFGCTQAAFVLVSTGRLLPAQRVRRLGRLVGQLGGRGGGGGRTRRRLRGLGRRLRRHFFRLGGGGGSRR
ncbi:MAG TPA: hypothetical protein VFF16_07810 [Telluria sp.]|nr:hypothetical protein [Telluria sp.]